MIRSIEIENFKSVAKAKLDLGRVNVLIGENGAGKSNFLEAIAFGSAASAKKLDYEFLASRGIRLSKPEFIFSAFDNLSKKIIFTFNGEELNEYINFSIESKINNEGDSYWTNIGHNSLTTLIDEISEDINKSESDLLRSLEVIDDKNDRLIRINEHINYVRECMKKISKIMSKQETISESIRLSSFLIFSPEYSSLRIFLDETQILPLGIRGEGLFAHLKALSQRNGGSFLGKISDQLDLIDWFEGFEMPDNLAPGERVLRIRDRYLVEQKVFDQRSANEGFLFLLFYFTLMISPDTPKFFAVDNVDASLNPKLCTALIRRMVELAKEHDKQLILTTHNPAVLDGLDLTDDEQRLFAVSRDSRGRTRLNRLQAPRPIGDDPAMRLSEAFLKGYLGGLPKNF